MKLANILWLSLIVLIILSGLLVGIGRLASPHLKEFKTDIETEVSRVVGSQVIIGEMNALWKGFGPALVLRDIQISHPDEKDATIELERIDLDISLKQIIQSGRALPWNIVLHGIQLELIRDESAGIQVVGFSGDAAARTDNRAFSLDPLFQLPRLEFRDTSIRWTDKTQKTHSTEFSQVNLLLRNDDDRHQLDLTFNLPGKKSQTLQVAADITATLDDIDNWSGDVFIKTRNFSVTGWLKSLMPDPFELLDGQTNTDVWIEVSNGQLASVLGSTAWQDVNIRRKDQDRALQVNRIGAQFELIKNHENWQLEIADFHLQSDEFDWPATRLSYRHARQANTFFAVDHIETRLWQPLADIFLPEKIASIPALDLDGSITNLHATWNHDLTAWYAQGQISALHALPEMPAQESDSKNSLPGFENLDAEFQFSESQGQLTIHSVDTTYIHPGLFRDPIKLDILEGQLKWQKTADKLWQIKTDQLTAISPHISTATRLLIEIPEEGKTRLDIQTDFLDGDATHASLYYPTGIMGKKLVNWLDRSIVSGHITSGSLILKGPAEDYAYSKTHNGHFEVLFNVENTVLDYFPEWPRLEEIDAQVRFHNNSLNIDVANARLLDTEVTEAVARINTLNPISPLRITGTTMGPASDNLRILSESPLREDFSRIASSISLSGNSKVKLDFQVPLGRLGKYELDGQVYFQHNNLQLNDWDLELQNIAGQLNFDLQGLKARNLSASLMDSPIKVDISHDSNKITHIQSQLDIHTDQLKQLVKAIPTEFISGKTRWDLDLQIPPVSSKNNKAAKLKLNSDLFGVDIKLPAPFAKQAQDKRPLSVTATLQPGSEMPLTFNYNNRIQASLMLDTSKPELPATKAAHLHFGSASRPASRDNSFQLSGHLDTLDLDEWLSWSQSLPEAGEASLPVDIDVSCTKLVYSGLQLDAFSLELNQKQKQLAGSVNSEQLSGSFEFAGNPQSDRFIARLDKATFDLNLDTLYEKDSAQPQADELDPTTLPGLDIVIKQFSLNDNDFGKALFRSSKLHHSMRLDEFRLEGDNLKMDATGMWSKQAYGQQTVLDFNFSSNDFGNALKQLGYTPQIEKGKADFSGNINWSGAPLDLNTKTLSGKLKMNLQDGRFLDIEPGVGRVLGILNIAALQRRLTLDFSDLFKEGFSFDEISANFSLDNGDAYTNDLFIAGPAAKINLSGRTGLYAKDYDQLVTVTPSLQSSITLAGAVAGGPAGAAVAFVAQKLIGKEVDKIARTRYTVTGSWDAPQVEKLKKLDTEPEENNNAFSDL